MARTKVVVFGSSSCSIDSSLYLHAMKLGELLATAGYDITNGGYSGIMEAVSLGASSVTDCTVCELF
jgi:predicted Rossmann-fold nucleotide-binding protein